MALVDTHQYGEIGPVAFFVVQWVLTGVALSFLIFRLVLHIRGSRKVFTDDLILTSALLMLLASNILWHFNLEHVYSMNAHLQDDNPKAVSWTDDIWDVLHMRIVFDILFYCSLWFTKFSVLYFCRHLCRGLRKWMGKKVFWWRTVLLVSIGTLFACIGDSQWECSIPGIGDKPPAYCLTDRAGDTPKTTMRINTALDVFSDLLIMTLPVILLRRIKTTANQKLGLVAACTLAIVAIASALIRLLVVKDDWASPDLTWIFMWANIEMAMLIAAASVGCLRQLYVNPNSSAQNTFDCEAGENMKSPKSPEDKFLMWPFVSGRPLNAPFPEGSKPGQLSVSTERLHTKRERQSFKSTSTNPFDHIHIKTDVELIETATQQQQRPGQVTQPQVQPQPVIKPPKQKKPVPAYRSHWFR